MDYFFCFSRCFQCASDITGKVPFEYMDFRFCSPKCLKEHRLKTAKWNISSLLLVGLLFWEVLIGITVAILFFVLFYIFFCFVLFVGLYGISLHAECVCVCTYVYNSHNTDYILVKDHIIFNEHLLNGGITKTISFLSSFYFC